MKPAILLFLIASSIFSCSEYGTITITAKDLKAVDNCFPIKVANKKVSVSREVEVVENTLTDTVGLGFAILAPKYTGKFEYARMGNGLVDTDFGTAVTDYPNISEICIDLQMGKMERKPKEGKHVIRFKY